MRVLVIGNGAREHALVWRLKQSPKVAEIYAAPGNAGMAEIANCVPIQSSSIIELADFAAELHMALTIVGPELPLTLGIADEFHKRDLRILAPSAAAAEIEGSKAFAKSFLKGHGIPTAAFDLCSSPEEAAAAVDRRAGRFPVVIKADGLAGGKGVYIAQDRAGADEALQTLMVERAFGNAGARVIVEDFLQGSELSFQVLVDGEHAVPLAVARDYKRALDGDQGPNTGGMGSISPSRVFSPELGHEVMRTIVQPTVAGLAADGRPFVGILYCGLMVTPEGPRVLEYNARLGDPETQSLMPRLLSDPVDLFLAAATGGLASVKPQWRKEVSVSVVLAAAGYPGKIETGQPIRGLDDVAKLPVTVFHAGTARKDDDVVTAAGRVLTVNATAPSRARAVALAYEAVERIRFEGMHFRRDIGSGEDDAAGAPAA